jgi:hypothetical protein
MGKWVNIIGEGKGKRYDVQDPFRDNAGRLSKIYISCFIELRRELAVRRG